MLRRRTLLQLGTAGAAASVLPRALNAQAKWPSGPVRIIVPSAPGGSLDILARLMGRGLQEKFGQPFVADNRSGGAGNIGYDVVSKSKPDGYTIVIASDPLVINPLMYSSVPFDTLRDFTPIIMVATLSQVLAVNPKVPANNFAEFIALARSQPNTLNIGTSGTGAPGHLAIALLKQANVPVNHVPYRGAGPAVVDALGGQIHGTIVTLPATLGMIKNNQLRPLAVTSSKRSRFIPDTPSMIEQLPGVAVDSWQAMFAPTGTPPEVITQLNTELAALFKTREISDAFETQAFEAGGGSPEDLGKFVRDEFTKWTPIIKTAGIKAD